mgnify:CR=1 FL=1
MLLVAIIGWKVSDVKNRIILVGVFIVAVVASSYFVLWYMNHLDYLSKTVHETNKWAIIMDSHGDIIAIETTSDQVWNTLVNLHQNGAQMWIGGIVEKYGNKWGFRFKPSTVNIAEVTAEGAQTWIKDISENLNYWMNTWAKTTYVWAKVTEIHG